MAEDDQESIMTINNKKVHFLSFSGVNKNDLKPIINRLSSSEDEYDYYQVYDESAQKRKKYDPCLEFVNEEEQKSEGYDSEDSNQADNPRFDYPEFADNEDESENDEDEYDVRVKKPTYDFLTNSIIPMKKRKQHAGIRRYNYDDNYDDYSNSEENSNDCRAFSSDEELY